MAVSWTSELFALFACSNNRQVREGGITTTERKKERKLTWELKNMVKHAIVEKELFQIYVPASWLSRQMLNEFLSVLIGLPQWKNVI